ncbi:M48 family metalloprotease [Seohaeicola zhoushanensis]|nr:M48 family metalloprotease [Seohaeicola zhoushanensis]
MTPIRRPFALLALCAALFTSACSDVVTVGPMPVSLSGGMPPQTAAAAFSQVVASVEPVAEAECQRRQFGRSCDFRIVVDGDPTAPANAFQSVDERGRPVITFTLALIAQAENADELAFVMGHEAAHHILDHLRRQSRSATAAAVVLGGLATLTGGSATDVETAQRLGAAVGARQYSKEYELEADELGTLIAYRAGFDPRIGVQFFARIPDPGDRFLGTHPPNAARVQTVQRTIAALGLS